MFRICTFSKETEWLTEKNLANWKQNYIIKNKENKIVSTIHYLYWKRWTSLQKQSQKCKFPTVRNFQQKIHSTATSAKFAVRFKPVHTEKFKALNIKNVNERLAWFNLTRPDAHWEIHANHLNSMTSSLLVTKQTKN